MRVFWDTNIFIYLWEKKVLTSEMEALSDFVDREGHILVTSTLTLGEILVQPMQQGKPAVVRAYQSAMHQLVLIPYDREAAACFARLRATNPSLRPPDAIQLACAIVGECELFITNDRRLANVKSIRGLRVESLSEWHSSRKK